jgi:hypothetical protein
MTNSFETLEQCRDEANERNHTPFNVLREVFMSDVLKLLQHAQMPVDTTTLRRLSVIVIAMFSMTGRVTMRGIARWTGKGGSYRTIQRFFNTTIDWAQATWCLLWCHALKPDEPIIVAGDETVVTKAGTQTHGLDTFFSSIIGKPVRGIAIFTWSLITVKQRRSFPLLNHQIFRKAPDTQHDGVDSVASKRHSKNKGKTKTKTKSKRKPGRPKGSKNKNREEVELSPYLLTLQAQLRSLQQLVGSRLPLVYVVLDGAFGTNYALQMVRRCGMHLISKLQTNSALYFPYTGPYSGHGPRRKYGEKVDYANLPSQYRVQHSTEKEIRTEIYQMAVLHKLFPHSLNVVILVKTHLKTQGQSHVILFSDDLTLSHETIVEYYKLRFQLEFNFRDAKQYWGLEDFMNIKEQSVTTAVNLSFFLVNVSQILLTSYRQTHPDFSLEDLKARFRGEKYVDETLKWLPEKPEPIIIQHMYDEVAKLGSINVA